MIRSIRVALLIGAATLVASPQAHAQRGGRSSAAWGASAGHYGGMSTSYGARSSSVVGPQGGYGSSYGQRSEVTSPYGASRSAGSASGSYTTGRGTTVDYGAAGAGGRTAGGVDYGRGVGGVQVTTASGKTATKVGTAGGAVGPGGVGVGERSSVGVASGPGGTVASASHGGMAVGPGGAVAGGSRATVASGPGGTVSAASRGGVAVGPYGTVAAGSRGAIGYGAGGVAVAGGRAVGGVTTHGTYYRSATAISTQSSYVRRSFGYYNAFSPTWYARYPGAWFTAGWVAGRVWAPMTWASVSTYCGYTALPIYYDYGNTVVYQDYTVYVNGESAGSTDQFAMEATKIADTGRQAMPPNDEDWQPLGVFAMVRGEEQTSDKIFQMAVSKSGVIRGNYYDAIADNTIPLYGSVDKTSQRAAWSIGDKKDIVYEAGIANLTQDQAPVLIHFGKDKTEQFLFVRIPPPADQPKK